MSHGAARSPMSNAKSLESCNAKSLESRNAKSPQ